MKRTGLFFIAFCCCLVFLSSIDAQQRKRQPRTQQRAKKTLPQETTPEGLEQEQKALVAATESGDIALVERLLAKGVDAHAKDEDEKAVLMIAVSKGHTAVVQALLAKGANPNAKAKNNRTTLMEAAKLGNSDIVQTLLTAGADVNAKDSEDVTALMMAGLEGHSDVVQALLSKGADVNARSKTGNTALVFAANPGDAAILQALLAKGAEVNAVRAGKVLLEDDLITVILKDGPGLRFAVKDIKCTSFGFRSRFTIRQSLGSLYEVQLKLPSDRLRMIDMQPVVFPLDTQSVISFVGAVPYPLRSGSLRTEQVYSNPPDPSGRSKFTLKLDPTGKYLQSWGMDSWLAYSADSLTVDSSTGTLSPWEKLFQNRQTNSTGNPSPLASVLPNNGQTNSIILNGSNLEDHLVYVGDPDNPLTFVFLKDIGLVYLYGEGEVKKSDGTILASWGKTAEDYRRRGDAYNNTRNYGSAIQEYSQAISLNPKYVVAYTNRGTAYHGKRDYDRAIQDYSRAITLDPKAAAAYNNRGYAYLGKGDCDQAIQDYNQTITLDPKLTAAYLGRGNAYYKKGELDRAIQDYSLAILLDQKLAAAYLGRAKAYYLLRKNDVAEADEKRANELGGHPFKPDGNDSAQVQALLDRVKQLISASNDDESLRVLRQIVRIYPTNAEAYYLTGTIHYRKGDQEASMNALKTASFWDTKHLQSRILLTRIYVSSGECDLAKLYTRILRELDANNQEIIGLHRLLEMARVRRRSRELRKRKLKRQASKSRRRRAVQQNRRTSSNLIRQKRILIPVRGVNLPTRTLSRILMCCEEFARVVLSSRPQNLPLSWNFSACLESANAKISVAYSLKVAETRTQEAERNGVNSRQRMPDIWSLGGITEPVAFVMDRQGGDVILVGERGSSRGALTLDDLVVALRARF
jgi:tetratricopeptide (TPR) repeat protein